MKQVVVAKGEYQVVDVPEPTPGPGDVLVRVSHSLISSGTEMSAASVSGRSLVRTVLRDPKLLRRAVTAVVRSGLGRVGDEMSAADAPRAIGYSCAGIVVGVGEEAPGFERGQVVACAGMGYANHAEVVAVPRNLVARVPEGITTEQAAFATARVGVADRWRYRHGSG
jgi:NADPH:quinone reductase-like Zn-dependent oxidoreductase